jgi:hypothetical protein
MACSIQQLPDDSKFSHALRFEVLEQLCPPELVSDLLSRCHAWGERERNLNQRVCRPMVTEQSKGAFRFGLRLMAIDGTLAYCRIRSVSSRRATARSLPALPCGAAGHACLDGSRHRLGCRAEYAGPSAAGPRASRVSAAGHYTHAKQVLSDGIYLVTLHPLGLPAEQVRVIAYRIEPHTAKRLAEFPSSQTSNQPDPRQLYRLVTTLLDPQQSRGAWSATPGTLRAAAGPLWA